LSKQPALDPPSALPGDECLKGFTDGGFTDAGFAGGRGISGLKTFGLK
jgi:hypothetical protein